MTQGILHITQAFSEEELPRILRIYAEGIEENAREFYPGENPAEAIRKEEDAYVRFFEQFLSAADNSYWILTREGEWVSALRLSEVKPRIFYLEALETRDDRRHQGNALALLQGVCELLKQGGPFRIADCVNKQNTASIKTHLKAGFQIVSEEGIDYLSGRRYDWEYSLLYEWNEEEYLFPSVRDRRIRKAEPKDFDRIMGIYRQAQDFMIRAGNPDQWGHRHPAPARIRQDIQEGICHLIVEDDEICGVFALLEKPDPAYARIEQGAWPNDKAYVTLHRVASDEGARSIFHSAAQYAKSISEEVRVDTHEKNAPMRRAIEAEGFARCGIIYTADDGTPRIAYQWSRQPEK